MFFSDRDVGIIIVFGNDGAIEIKNRIEYHNDKARKNGVENELALLNFFGILFY